MTAKILIIKTKRSTITFEELQHLVSAQARHEVGMVIDLRRSGCTMSMAIVDLMFATIVVKTHSTRSRETTLRIFIFQRNSRHATKDVELALLDRCGDSSRVVCGEIGYVARSAEAPMFAKVIPETQESVVFLELHVRSVAICPAIVESGSRRELAFAELIRDTCVKGFV